jgi:hypothetical protein
VALAAAVVGLDEGLEELLQAAASNEIAAHRIDTLLALFMEEETRRVVTR